MPLPVSPNAPNPHIAFVWVTINGQSITVDDVTNRPKHLESFSCNFMVKELGMFELVLFDPKYDVVETALSESDGTCNFWFGYTTGDISPTYTGTILSYLPEFLHDGIRLSISGIMSSVIFHQNIETRTWENKEISTIVEEIAANRGWKSEVQKTSTVWNRESLEETDLEKVTIRQSSSDFSFIQAKLLKLSERSSDKVGGYVLYFDHATQTLHFHPPKYEEGPIRTFVWRKKDTEVIRFSPHYNGQLLMRMFLGGASQAPSMDATDSSTSENVHSDKKGTGTGKSTDPNRVSMGYPDVDTAFRTPGKIIQDYRDKYFGELEAKYWWYTYAYMGAFTGELEIVGDPKIEPYKKYEIQVHKATGGLHWTSGLYWCAGVSHKIEGGRFTTILRLWASGEKTGKDVREKLS